MTRRRSLALAAASLAGLPIAGLWVALTAATGKTYHLAPVLGADAPAVAARLVARPTAHQAALLALAGLLTVAGGWAALAALGTIPTATVVDGQPGGVPAEIVLGAISGAGAGVRSWRRGRT